MKVLDLKPKTKLEKALQIKLHQAMGALGHPVPEDIPEDTSIRCGLCEAKYRELIMLRGQIEVLKGVLSALFGALK